MDTKLQIEFIKAHLQKPITLVGLMGAGKSSLGKKMAETLDIDFVDSDEVIVTQSGMSISDIFAKHGEAHFRALECETILSLAAQKRPYVIGTGGGAFMNKHTRAAILDNTTSLFIKATLDVLSVRVGDGAGRPMFKDKNPIDVLQSLMDERYPVYALADLTVASNDEPVEETLNRGIATLYTHLKPA